MASSWDLEWIQGSGACATCTHPQTAHLHHREGTDCSAPECECRRFKGEPVPVVMSRRRFWFLAVSAGFGWSHLVGLLFDLFAKLGG